MHALLAQYTISLLYDAYQHCRYRTLVERGPVTKPCTLFTVQTISSLTDLPPCLSPSAPYVCCWQLLPSQLKHCLIACFVMSVDEEGSVSRLLFQTITSNWAELGVTHIEGRVYIHVSPITYSHVLLLEQIPIFDTINSLLTYTYLPS